MLKKKGTQYSLAILNKKKMAGRVPLENVSEKKKQNERTRFGRRLLIFEINRLPKMNLPGET
jgi:hypothetical protein